MTWRGLTPARSPAGRVTQIALSVISPAPGVTSSPPISTVVSSPLSDDPSTVTEFPTLATGGSTWSTEGRVIGTTVRAGDRTGTATFTGVVASMRTTETSYAIDGR